MHSYDLSGLADYAPFGLTRYRIYIKSTQMTAQGASTTIFEQVLQFQRELPRWMSLPIRKQGRAELVPDAQ
ncbi:hypothetical protein XaplCFBP3122_16655 [Xanthomonas arboricola pv. populi]|uniref:Uncharacterized protein n=1 Tax=Xanthomonas arboricola pv. populi TaxID=487823 RepID=A0A2S6Z150_9XANT|nr:hypothetical protein XaplCFBP3122_16655 [Xanthomonas arboricola pv. populi]